MSFWGDKRVVVTGGAGFLGSFVLDKLCRRGCKEIVVPRRRDYDLVSLDAVRLRDLRDRGQPVRLRDLEVRRDLRHVSLSCVVQGLPGLDASAPAAVSG